MTFYWNISQSAYTETRDKCGREPVIGTKKWKRTYIRVEENERKRQKLESERKGDSHGTKKGLTRNKAEYRTVKEGEKRTDDEGM